MINFSRAILFELEEKLHSISFDYDNPIEMSENAIKIILEYIGQLKEYLASNNFKTQEDEIQYFKHIKPKFVSKLIYYKKIHLIESRRPPGSEKVQKKYLNKELNKLTTHFDENKEFYDYFRLGINCLDDKLFVRGKAKHDWNLETFYYEMDHRFATTHDYKVAAIIANEALQRYIENKIQNHSVSPNPLKIEIEKPAVKWTENKTSLIELIYALHTEKVFNDGKTELVEIAKYFERIFDIELGDIYRASNEIKNRKINKTKFLDRLKENLNKRFEEQEYR